MKKPAGAFVCGLLLLLSMAPALFGADEALPPSGFGGWKLDGKARTYSGDALYNHIDGGAETFLEMGFEACEVRRYKKGDMELTAESYGMADSTAALGIYLMQCGRETPDPGFDERHTVGENQLTLVKGRHLIRFTGKPGACPGREVFLLFARESAGKVEASPPPPILAGLPQEGRVEGSERLVRGPVTLSTALAPPFSPEALLLGRDATGAAADYTGGPRGSFTYLAVAYPSVARAEVALDSLSRDIAARGGAPAPKDGGITFATPSGKQARASVRGTVLAVAWGFDPPEPTPTRQNQK